MKSYSRDMVVKAINTPISNNVPQRQQKGQGNNQKPNINAPSFQGGFNPVVTLMDAIDRGGFAASFIAQDGIGMVAPRIKEGLNRGRDKDENGKLRGPLNWEFARKEGLREILSGPSAFIIPAVMMHFISKHSGSANNVSVDMIKGLGQTFEKYAAENSTTLSDVAKTKTEFYENVFKNILKTTTTVKEGDTVKSLLTDDEIGKLAKDFTSRTIEIENAKPKGFLKNLLGIKVEGSAEDLTQSLTDEFMQFKKQHLSPSVNEMVAELKINGRENNAAQTFNKFLGSLKNYSDDAINSVNKQLEKDGATDVAKFIETHTSRRMGSRVISNLSMFLAVVGFYTIIPKLYNLGLKGNPALKGEEQATDAPEAKKDTKSEVKKNNGKNISFEGAGIQKAMKKTGETVMNKNWLKKLSDKFEFDGASMSVPAMLTLLFGFCLPPRYINRQDEYDGKEILVRDIASFSAILFGAKALSRGCSQAFSKLSGLALNTKPSDHDKSFLHKLKNYFTPASGVNVLSSGEITSKYSNIDKYPGGINGFFEFIENSGGNIKKILGLDKNVKANAEAIIGKPLKNSSIDEIKNAFKNVKNTEALENIYKTFRNGNNKFINYAKTMNSFFGALSTLALVPAFMIWLARYCDNMTKRDRAKHLAAETQNNQPAVQEEQIKKQTEESAKVQKTSITQKPTMAGFLNK